MNSSIAIQVLPAVQGRDVIRVVDEVIAYLKSTGLNVFVGPFETTVEGDFEQLMAVVAECQRLCIRAGAPSVMSYVKISYNPTTEVMTIAEKVTKHHS